MTRTCTIVLCCLAYLPCGMGNPVSNIKNFNWHNIDLYQSTFLKQKNKNILYLKFQKKKKNRMAKISTQHTVDHNYKTNFTFMTNNIGMHDYFGHWHNKVLNLNQNFHYDDTTILL